MATDVIDRYRRWFEYEQDVHAKVLASLETVPGGRRDSSEFRKAVAIFAHVVAARRMWLARLGVIDAAPGGLFPDQPDVAQVAELWREVQGLWRGFLAEMDDAGLARVFEYQSLDAGRFRNRIEDILAQLFGHSSYHRGQIAMLVRSGGRRAGDHRPHLLVPRAGGERRCAVNEMLAAPNDVIGLLLRGGFGRRAVLGLAPRAIRSCPDRARGEILHAAARRGWIRNVKAQKGRRS